MNGSAFTGVIGAMPWGITTYLQQKFWIVNTSGPITYFWGILAELSGAVIVLYKNANSMVMHYVAGIKVGNGVGGSFQFYNCTIYDNTYKKAAISIWSFIDLLESRGCLLLAIWGVSLKKGWW